MRLALPLLLALLCCLLAHVWVLFGSASCEDATLSLSGALSLPCTLPHTGTVPLVSVSPAPTDDDFLFHLEDFEGLEQLYDMTGHTHTQLTNAKASFFEVTP